MHNTMYIHTCIVHVQYLSPLFLSLPPFPFPFLSHPILTNLINQSSLILQQAHDPPGNPLNTFSPNRTNRYTLQPPPPCISPPRRMFRFRIPL